MLILAIGFKKMIGKLNRFNYMGFLQFMWEEKSNALYPKLSFSTALVYVLLIQSTAPHRKCQFQQQI